jgi:broad specificity phosphatase PhoE
MLVLARHGECVANTERCYVGRRESPLTARGERQAERLAGVIAADGGLRIRRIVSSPLGRAVRTAEAIAAALAAVEGGAHEDVEIDERFVELDYGELDGEPIGATPGDSAQQAWRRDPDVAVPKGESLRAVAERVAGACADLHAWRDAAVEAERRAKAEPPVGVGPDVLVVSHVVPIKLAVCWALGVSPLAVWRMNLAVASLTRITMNGPTPGLERYNEHGYLGEDLSPPIWR